MLEEFLYFVVNVMAYKCRTAVFNGNIRSVSKCSYVFRVSQHIVKRIYLELSACSGAETAAVELIRNSLLSLTICVHGKCNTRYICCGFINFKVLIGGVLLCGAWSENKARNERIRTEMYVHRLKTSAWLQMGRHSFKHCFGYYAFRIIRKAFGRGYNLYAVLFQLVFIECAVVAITAESVEFVNKHKIEKSFCTVRNHLKELWSICGFR